MATTVRTEKWLTDFTLQGGLWWPPRRRHRVPAALYCADESTNGSNRGLDGLDRATELMCILCVEDGFAGFIDILPPSHNNLFLGLILFILDQWFPSTLTTYKLHILKLFITMKTLLKLINFLEIIGQKQNKKPKSTKPKNKLIMRWRGYSSCMLSMMVHLSS
jgi:hypothetical protein